VMSLHCQPAIVGLPEVGEKQKSIKSQNPLYYKYIYISYINITWKVPPQRLECWT
jgi:hypothetical protein